eukprot:scpid97712/ scgid33498/ 
MYPAMLAGGMPSYARLDSIICSADHPVPPPVTHQLALCLFYFDFKVKRVQSELARPSHLPSLIKYFSYWCQAAAATILLLAAFVFPALCSARKHYRTGSCSTIGS